MLQAAHDMLLERGYRGTSARAVYAKCGLKEGSFTHAFRRGIREIADGMFLQIHHEIWAEALIEFQLPAKDSLGAALKAAQKSVALKIGADRRRARLYFELLDGAAVPIGESPINDRLASSCDLMGRWCRAVAPNAAGALPLDQCHALLFGNVLEAGRTWATGRSEVPPRLVLSLIATPTWLTKKGRSRDATGAEDAGDMLDVLS